jgi:hypothetical protein
LNGSGIIEIGSESSAATNRPVISRATSRQVGRRFSSTEIRNAPRVVMKV